MRADSPLGSGMRRSPRRDFHWPRAISPKFVLASHLTRDDKALQKEKIPYVIYMELRNDLEFTRAQLVEAQEKVRFLNQEVLILTQNNMQL